LRRIFRTAADPAVCRSDSRHAGLRSGVGGLLYGAGAGLAGSHVSEIVRGALQAIPRGQIEAGKAIGLRFNQTLRYLLLPQAMRQILPTWVNSSTEIVKASTLLSVIGVAELLLSTQQVIARTFMTLEFYLFAGFLFFLINYAIELLGRQIEKRVALP
ncbi:amino acid ABC transporter permease, partial [Pseudomonas syringae pv. actinidiae ICMP 18804]